MQPRPVVVEGRTCSLYVVGEPQVLLLHLVHDRHRDELDDTLRHLVAGGRPFAMLALPVADWERELMPWAEPAVSRRPEVGSGAEATLRFIVDDVLPHLAASRRVPTATVVLGGYSLGGLFALWAARHTAAFTAVAAASPSLWVGDWPRFADSHAVRADYVYLSLGDGEEHTRNAAMARCGDRLRGEYARLLRQLPQERVALVWEQGGHFADPGARMARAYAWCLEQCGRCDGMSDC